MGRDTGRLWQKIIPFVSGVILFSVHFYGQLLKTTLPIFEQRPFLGNGHIGLIIAKDYCFLDTAIHIEIGSTINIPYQHQVTGAPFSRPIGYFVLKAQNDVVSASPTMLHRDKGYAEGAFKTKQGGIRWRLLASQSPRVGLLCLKIEGKEPFPFWGFTSYRLNTEENLPPLKQGEIEGSIFTWQEMPNKGSFTSAWDSVKLDYESPWDYVIFFTHECSIGIENNEKSNALTAGKMPNARLRISTNAELDEILSTNEHFWHEVYRHSSLSIPNENLSQIYQEALYRFASATFSQGNIIDIDGPMPAQPDNPTLDMIAWGGYLQQTYNFCFRSGLCSFFAPVAQHFISHPDTLARNTDLPRNDVAALPAFTTPYLIPLYQNLAPITLLKPDRKKTPRYYLLWAMYLYYQYCQYAHSEEELLHRFYPLLQKSVNFCLSELEEDENGIFHVPEKTLQNGSVTKDATAELSLLKWALQWIETIEHQTHGKTTMSNTYKTINTHLAKFPFDQQGLLPGSDVDVEKHPLSDYEHLLSFYPLQLFSWDIASHRVLIKNSVQRLINNLPVLGTKNDYLYSACASMAAWMEDGDLALLLLQEYLNTYHSNAGLHNNGFGSFARPMGVANALQDMCLQNINHLTKIFPALPSAWENVAFSNWKTFGNISISASQANGQFEKVSFSSPHDKEFTMDVQLPAARKYLKCNSPKQILFLKETEGKAIYRIKLTKEQPIYFEYTAP